MFALKVLDIFISDETQATVMIVEGKITTSDHHSGLLEPFARWLFGSHSAGHEARDFVFRFFA